MYLNRSIPLLFGTPNSASSRVALVCSILTIVLALIIYFSALVWVAVPYFLLMSLLLGLHGFICLTTTGANVLYIFRYFLVSHGKNIQLSTILDQKSNNFFNLLLRGKFKIQKNQPIRNMRFFLRVFPCVLPVSVYRLWQQRHSARISHRFCSHHV